jgi:hypothetical protein
MRYILLAAALVASPVFSATATPAPQPEKTYPTPLTAPELQVIARAMFLAS